MIFSLQPPESGFERVGREIHLLVDRLDGIDESTNIQSFKGVVYPAAGYVTDPGFIRFIFEPAPSKIMRVNFYKIPHVEDLIIAAKIYQLLKYGSIDQYNILKNFLIVLEQDSRGNTGAELEFLPESPITYDDVTRELFYNYQVKDSWASLDEFATVFRETMHREAWVDLYKAPYLSFYSVPEDDAYVVSFESTNDPKQAEDLRRIYGLSRSGLYDHAVLLENLLTRLSLDPPVPIDPPSPPGGS